MDQMTYVSDNHNEKPLNSNCPTLQFSAALQSIVASLCSTFGLMSHTVLLWFSFTAFQDPVFSK